MLTHVTRTHRDGRLLSDDAMTLHDRFSSIPRHARAHKRVNSNLPSLCVNASSMSGMWIHDPMEWAQDLNGWAADQCGWSDRILSSVRSLHDNFGAWCVKHGSVPCRRDTFEALLENECFLISDGLVCGLALKTDILALGRKR